MAVSFAEGINRRPRSSSGRARKQLANEIGVRAVADESAEENIALQRAVMRKLEENGGQAPASLKSH
jgi:hypothetical protein